MKKTRLKNRPMGTGAWCSHVANGLMGIPKICIRDFECRHCAFYYWLEEAGATPVCDECLPVDFLLMEGA